MDTDAAAWERHTVREEMAKHGLGEPRGSVESLVSSEGEALEHMDSESLGLGALQLQSRDELLARRRRAFGANLAILFPEDPLVVEAGRGCHLFASAADADRPERGYLDCINNVSHVGHANPRVAGAIAAQLGQLNTNSRYLSPTHVAYAEELLGTLPAPLSKLYLASSGSEANELALRVARVAHAARGERRPMHVAVLDHAYHGHTNACMDLSPYKFYGPGGAGRPDYVHVLPCPDTYRGTGLDGGAAARAAVAAARDAGARIGAFFAESVVSCGGQFAPPPGWLRDAYAVFRAEGAVCVADEVQAGFGRAGRAFWAFERHGVVPDAVSMGKPMGNGYPISGLALRAELAETFAAHGGDFFATHGGSNAAIAAGRAVLREIRDQSLQRRALEVGEACLEALRALQRRFPGVVGDVRGEGLMIGVELVTRPDTKEPHPALAAALRAGCKRHHRVLINAEGPFGNVVKIKPPLCFSERDAERMVGAMRDQLGALLATEEGAQELVAASKARVAELQRLREEKERTRLIW
ncbi:hypothetical protein QBZ16_001330 [Prototheca wickerhamii]|uniref:Uncharacterized protein n=1 Tax=Prototheca wickerhamii TaxID=3111 RepID=A0AAD9IDF2_PROWI|nr:hypothetical protein QBZ16_001330 [Prototheca wickerhamii]